MRLTSMGATVTVVLASGACMLFFDETGGGGSTGSGGSGGGGDCLPGLVRVGDQWAVGVPETELRDLTEGPGGRIYFAGTVPDREPRALGPLAAGPRFFVASVNPDGCGLVVHDLGSATGDGEITLSHGTLDAREVLVAWTPMAQAGRALCVARADGPGPVDAGHCTKDSLLRCTADVDLDNPAVAAAEAPFVVFDVTSDGTISCNEKEPESIFTGLNAIPWVPTPTAAHLNPGLSRARLSSTGDNTASLAARCTSDEPACAPAGGLLRATVTVEDETPTLGGYDLLTAPDSALDQEDIAIPAAPDWAAFEHKDGSARMLSFTWSTTDDAVMSWSFAPAAVARVRSLEPVPNENAALVTGLSDHAAQGAPESGLACDDMAGTCVGNPYAFVAELMQFTYVARSFHALGRSGCAHAEARGGTRRDAFMTAGGIYRCGSLALGDLTVDVEAAPGTTATFLTRQAWSPR